MYKMSVYKKFDYWFCTTKKMSFFLFLGLVPHVENLFYLEIYLDSRTSVLLKVNTYGW